MPLHAWRRQHGPDIVSEVEPVEGIGTWRVSVWLVANSSVAIRLPTNVSRLQSAQARADTLARQTFDHKCQVDTCGEWLPIDSISPVE